MNDWRAHDPVLAKAIELDDDLPLDICPGCQRDMSHQPWDTVAHFPLRDPDLTTPWVTGATTEHIPMGCCPWTSDMLEARRYRRLYIEANVLNQGESA